MSEHVVDVRGLQKSFRDGRGVRKILDGVSLSVDAGEMIALVGPSGCGKTTLLSILGGLDVEFEGEAKVLDTPLRTTGDDGRTRLRNQSMGFVFQSFHLLEHLSAVENVQVPLWLLPERLPRTEELRRAHEALEWVGLRDRAGDGIGPLSGGERQRVAIARALVGRPRLLLADEPTGNLDGATGHSIIDIFGRARAGELGSPCAVIIATHDVAIASRANRILRLDGGRLAEGSEA